MSKFFCKSILILLGITVISLHSCELFSIDNYDEPDVTIKGKIVDVANGEPVFTDQGGEGIRVRLRELSWKGTEEPANFDIWCMKEGVYQNTKIFAGHYNVRIDGPFIPLVRLSQQGDTLVDESKYVNIKGVTTVDFQVQPFLKIEWVGEPTVVNGKITASFKVTRGVNPDDFKSKIEPMGGWDDDFLNIIDIRLFVSQVAYVGYREYDSRYSVLREYSGDSFEARLGETITLTTNGIIPIGRTVFIRAAARINYATEGIRRYNYNEAKRVDIQ